MRAGSLQSPWTHRLAWICVSLAGVYWLVESAADYFLFRMGSWLECAFPTNAHELWMRLAGVLALLVCAAVVQVMARRRPRDASTPCGNEQKHRSVCTDSDNAICVRSKERKPTDINCSALKLFGFTGEEVSDLDVRPLKRRLLHAQRMATLGTLASGVAHDFNNLLTAINGYTDAARRSVSPGHPARQSLDMVMQAAAQGAEVTKFLLMFSSKTVSGRSKIDLADVVADAVRLLRRIVPRSIEFVEDFRSVGPLWVEGDAAQLQQVLMNLVINAHDAMPRGGRLRIHLDRKAEPAPQGSPADGVASREGAILVVQDDGTGMPDETLSRLFGPFFTTRPYDQHTGLGLSVIQGIIEEHQGLVFVDSELGKGTRVTVWLPCCDPPEAALSRPRGRVGRSADRLILLAQGERHTRAIMTTCLRSAGYAVLGASDGVSVLDQLQAHQARVRLVILDEDLPGAGWRACVAAIDKLDRDVPLIIAASETDPDWIDDRHARFRVLRKPFQVRELTDLVSQAIAAPVFSREVRCDA